MRTRKLPNIQPWLSCRWIFSAIPFIVAWLSHPFHCFHIHPSLPGNKHVWDDKHQNGRLAKFKPSWSEIYTTLGQFSDDPTSSSSTSFIKNQKYNVSLLLIDHYDSFTYNLYDMVAQLTTTPPVVITKDAIDMNENDNDSFSSSFFNQFDGLILSPGPGTPQEQPALSHLSIKQNPQLPILGVCLGHQLLALNYGAKVDRAPIPIHGQDHWITIQQPKDYNDQSANNTKYPSIFQNLPSSFRVVRYHSLCAYDLPKSKDNNNLIVTATSQSDNVIQGIQHNEFPHYGVQFHPESIGTQYGMALLENFVNIVQTIKNEKLDKQLLKETPGNPSHERILRQQEIESKPPAPHTNNQRFRVMIHQLSSTDWRPLQVFEQYYSNLSYAMWLDSSSYPSRGELDILSTPTHQDDIIEYYYQDQDHVDILTLLENELFGCKSDNQKYAASTTIGWLKSFNSENDNIKQTNNIGLEWIDEIDDDDSKTKSIPFDYRGGFLGYLGYEVRYDTQRYLQKQGGKVNGYTRINKKEGEESSPSPTAAFFLARQSMVYHHPTESWYMIGLVENDKDIADNLTWMERITKEMQGEYEDNAKHPSLKQSFGDKNSSLEFIPNRSKQVYEMDIADCHEYIRMGESYELCLTNQLEAYVPDTSRSPFHLYKILRESNPAPYSAFFRWNVADADTEASSMVICSSSPERFMSVTLQKPHAEIPSYLQAEAKPIKGTCARVLPQNGICRTDGEAREDERRARSLELSLKNRAENLMIVDLLRNDMSRVCQIGTVRVAKLMDIESFATVHQMVSTIQGTLSDTSTSIDLLRASFPGGSMTGAPKIRTMELLEKLERGVERGPYAGSLGYISVNGAMDMNIIIRSAILTESKTTDDWKVSIGAGGAITALSDAEDEYNEMQLKARAVVSAVQKWAAITTKNSTALVSSIIL